MTDSLHQANQALRELDEAHASGTLERQRYREERRRLLATITESRQATAHAAVPAPSEGPSASASPSTRWSTSVWVFASLIFVASMIAVIGAVGY